MKKVRRKRRISIQEFEATRDAVRDLTERMIKTGEQVDRIDARVMDINTYLKRLDEIEDRLKRLEEKARGYKSSQNFRERLKKKLIR